MDKERPLVQVANIVTRSQIRSPFDLRLLTKRIPFDSNVPALARIPITHGKTKFSIFHSGAVISRASKSITEFEDNLLLLYEQLQTFKLELELEYTISNIVAFAKLSLSRLDLLALANQIPQSSYDPSAADSTTEGRGLNVIVYPLNKRKPRKTILIFASSAITLTGFKSLPDLKNQIYQFQKLLQVILKEHPEVEAKK